MPTCLPWTFLCYPAGRAAHSRRQGTSRPTCDAGPAAAQVQSLVPAMCCGSLSTCSAVRPQVKGSVKVTSSSWPETGCKTTALLHYMGLARCPNWPCIPTACHPSVHAASCTKALRLPQRRATSAATGATPLHRGLPSCLACSSVCALVSAGWSESSDTESQASSSDAGSDSDGSIRSQGGAAAIRDRLGSSRVRLAVLSCIQVSKAADPQELLLTHGVLSSLLEGWPPVEGA